MDDDRKEKLARGEDGVLGEGEGGSSVVSPPGGGKGGETFLVLVGVELVAWERMDVSWEDCDDEDKERT